MIVAEALTADGFAAFGQVLSGLDSGPERHDFAALVQNARPDARLNIAFVRTALDAVPVTLRLLERHAYSHQLFVPMRDTQQLVVVCGALDSGEPDIGQLRAFVSAGNQAVNYAAGTWHAPRMAIAGSGEFIMARWDDGGPEDTHFRDLDTTVEISVRA